MRDFFEVFVPVILFILVIFLVVGGFVYYLNYGYCERMEKLAPEYKFDFDFYGGCLVQTSNGYWTNADEYFKRLEIVQPESVK